MKKFAATLLVSALLIATHLPAQEAHKSQEKELKKISNDEQNNLDKKAEKKETKSDKKEYKMEKAEARHKTKKANREKEKMDKKAGKTDKKENEGK